MADSVVLSLRFPAAYERALARLAAARGLTRNRLLMALIAEAAAQELGAKLPPPGVGGWPKGKPRGSRTSTRAGKSVNGR